MGFFVPVWLCKRRKCDESLPCGLFLLVIGVSENFGPVSASNEVELIEIM